MYRIVLDTETAGNIEDRNSLRVYDFGFQLVDNNFNVVLEHRYFVNEVFGNHELMNSAYYANKLPQYYQALANGEVELRPWLAIMKEFAELCKAYKVKEVWAFNAGFDRDATNATTAALSNGFKTWFMPYGVEWKCIQRATAMTVCNSSNYFKFAYENGFISAKGNVQTTAEAVYAYLTNNPTYKEEHTALEDVKIETAILARVKRRHQKMETKPNRAAWQAPHKRFKAWLKKNVK